MSSIFSNIKFGQISSLVRFRKIWPDFEVICHAHVWTLELGTTCHILEIGSTIKYDIRFFQIPYSSKHPFYSVRGYPNFGDFSTGYGNSKNRKNLCNRFPWLRRTIFDKKIHWPKITKNRPNPVRSFVLLKFSWNWCCDISRNHRLVCVSQDQRHERKDYEANTYAFHWVRSST